MGSSPVLPTLRLSAAAFHPLFTTDARLARHNPVVPPILDVRGLRKSFGAVAAVRDVSFTVRRGELVGPEWGRQDDDRLDGGGVVDA